MPSFAARATAHRAVVCGQRRGWWVCFVYVLLSIPCSVCVTAWTTARVLCMRQSVSEREGVWPAGFCAEEWGTFLASFKCSPDLTDLACRRSHSRYTAVP